MAALWATDACILLGAIYAAYFLRYADVAHLARDIWRYAPHALSFTGFTLLAMVAVGVYEGGAVGRRPISLGTRLLVAFLLALILIAVTGFLLRDFLLWRSGLLIAFAIAGTAMFASRMLWAWTDGADTLVRRVFLVGDRELLDRLESLSREVRPRPFLVVGRLDLEDVLRLNGRCPEEVVARVRASRAQELVVAALERRGRLPLEVLLRCRANGIQVLDYATFFERETGRVDLDVVRPSWFAFCEGFEGTRFEHLAKRLLDIAAASAVLILALPLMLLVAICILLEDGRPVLYWQLRTGCGGVPFRLCKFRSMRRDAESGGPRYARPGDGRVTRVGRWIRRLRIDELPQLFNVLAGQMSFVGPRPERPEFVTELARQIPYFEQRHRMKPGLCGWAQLNAPYADDAASSRLKLEYDLYYLKHWSLLFDLAIILQTLRVVLWGPGAR